jgi:maltooligosyltrehalose trehalohydrolase
MTTLFHGTRFGPRGVQFSIWAPRARQLTLRLDGRDLAMSRQPDGFFTAEVPEARPGSRYSVVFEDGRVRPDPASRWQPDGVHKDSALFDPGRFRWTDSAWKGVPQHELVFYELHIGTFTEGGTFDAAAERLPELVELGVTCVELLPVQAFPGDRNWGYDGVQPYSVQHSYGGPEGLQRFVDRAHALGLAVCLDVVYNHLGPEGNYLNDFGPYFTSRHRSPWGDGVNFDGEDAGPVRAYAVGSALQWVRDFHVDALRLDAVHAIPDDSPRHVVGELCDAVRAYAQQSGRRIQVIAESDLNDRKVVDPSPRGWGCSASWADDFHHALHVLLTGEQAHFYADFAKGDLARALSEGFVYQGQESKFRKKRHGTDTRGLRPEQFVVFAQNHDQVGNRPTGERLTALVPPEALPAIAALVVLGPGLPLIFMGEEYGETNPFLYFTSHSDPQLAKAVSEGRKSEFIAGGGVGEVPDPQSTETFARSRLTHRRDGRHGELRRTFKELLALRRRLSERIAGEWPTVRVEGTRFTLERSFLEVTVNLGPTPQGELPAWGYRVREK